MFIDFYNMPKTVVVGTQHLLSLSQRIEDRIHQEPEATLFVGWQAWKYFVPQIERYQALSQDMNITFFCQEHPPLGLTPAIETIKLPAHDRLSNLWFLVANSTQFKRGLIAHEQARSFSGHRRFKVTLLFDDAFIDRSVTHLQTVTLLHKSNIKGLPHDAASDPNSAPSSDHPLSLTGS